MSGPVATTQTLQERVGQRIREQIGNLLTEDDLKKLVETALHEAFFKERREIRQYGQDILHPPAVVEIVKGLLKERVDAAVSAWLDAHKDEFAQHIQDQIGKGFTRMLQDWLDLKLQNSMMQLGENMKSALGVRGY